MADLNRPLIYALADALGMQLQYDPSSGDVNGSQERHVNMHGLRLTVPMTIVSSRLTNNAYMLMARVLGNLGVFVSAKRVDHRDVVELHILNLAKMDRLEGWLEKRKNKTNGDVVEALKPAIAKSYVKNKPNSWEAA